MKQKLYNRKKTGFTTSFDVDQRVLTSLPTSKKNTK